MQPELHQRWQRIAETFSSPFRLLARDILDGKHDFELLWRLADFAQLCIRYPSLLLLSHGFHDPEFRKRLFAKPPHKALHRATLGQWLGFLADGIEHLRSGKNHGPLAPLAGISPEIFERVGIELVRERNQLAHGVPGRMRVTEEQVNTLSRLVLDIAENLAEICQCELVAAPPHLKLHNQHGTLNVWPFILPGATPDDPRLYDTFEQHALFASRDSLEAVREVSDSIRGYLKFPPVASGSRASFRQHIEKDEPWVDLRFNRLPHFAGRPAFAARLDELFGSPAGNAIVMLYGPRGSGKRAFLAGFFELFEKRGHVVAVFADEWSSSELPAFLAEMESGAGVENPPRLPDRPLLLALLDIDGWLARPERSRLLRALLEHTRARPTISVLLMADASAPTVLELLRPLPILAVAMPPAEEDASSAFYHIVALTEGTHLPPWTRLPAEARELNRFPAAAVRFCRNYKDRALDESFSIAGYDDTQWHERFTADTPPTGAMEAPLSIAVDILADRMRAGRRRAVPITDFFDAAQSRSVQPLMKRAIQDLILLGYIEERSSATSCESEKVLLFAEFQWLRRALYRQVAAPLREGRHADLLRETEGFPPLGDALSDFVREAPVESAMRLFEALFAARLANHGRLVEALLLGAYQSPDSRLFARFLQRALQATDVATVEACAAVAGQLIPNGGEAADVGRSLLVQALHRSKALGLGALTANLHNEIAERVLPWKDRRARREHLDRAIHGAITWKNLPLEHIARNNLAALLTDIVALGPLRLAEPADCNEAIRLLEPVATTAATAASWTPVQVTRLQLARAHAALEPHQTDSARRYLTEVVELAQRYGTPADLSLAHFNIAQVHCFLGEWHAARTAFAQAAHLARLTFLPEALQKERNELECAMLAGAR